MIAWACAAIQFHQAAQSTFIHKGVPVVSLSKAISTMLSTVLLAATIVPSAVRGISKGVPDPEPNAHPYTSSIVNLLGGYVPPYGGHILCSGVLISPRLILTASHCFGTQNGASPYSPGDALNGGDRDCKIEDSDGAIVSPRITGCGWVLLPSSQKVNVGHVWLLPKQSSFGSQLFSNDIAIAALDERVLPPVVATKPWLDSDPGIDHWKQAAIVYGGFGETQDVGGSSCDNYYAIAGRVFQGYAPPAVVFGKRLDGDYPVDSNGLAYVNGTPTNYGGPMFIAKYSVIGDTWGVGLDGDSGGPLFAFDSLGNPRVAGIFARGDCKFTNAYSALENAWVRTMNTDVAAFIRRVAMRADGTFYGDTVSEDDFDGDGVATHGDGGNSFVNDSDNCPGLYNPDQQDSNHDGIGDACEGPGPTQSPVCMASPMCGNEVFVDCDAINYTLELDKDDGICPTGKNPDGSCNNASDHDDRHWPMVQINSSVRATTFAFDAVGYGNTTYQVCATTPNSQVRACDLVLPVTLPDPHTCPGGGGSIGGDSGGGTHCDSSTSKMCGGYCIPKSHSCIYQQ